jgi:hypothetical protein
MESGMRGVRDVHDRGFGWSWLTRYVEHVVDECQRGSSAEGFLGGGGA